MPGGERRGQDHLNYVDVTLPHQEIDGWSIVRSKTQAVHDHFVIDLAGHEDLVIQGEQQAQLAQFAQCN